MKGHRSKDIISNGYMRKFLKSAHEGDPGYVIKGRRLRFGIDVNDVEDRSRKKLRTELRKMDAAQRRKRQRKELEKAG